MPPELDRLLQEIIGTMADVNAQLEAGTITVDQWQRLQAVNVLVGHNAAFMTGKGSDVLTPEERKAVTATVADQIGYLNGFADTIDQEGWQAGYGARALLYGGSIKVSFWRGRTGGWDLPYMPAENTACYSNCKCTWEPGTLDEENLTGEWYWRRAADDSCKTCIQRERETPIRFVEGERV